MKKKPKHPSNTVKPGFKRITLDTSIEQFEKLQVLKISYSITKNGLLFGRLIDDAYKSSHKRLVKKLTKGE